MIVHDAVLVDECDGCETVIEKETTRSKGLLARDLWNADRGNKRVGALFIRENGGKPGFDPKLTIELRNKRVLC